MRGKEGQTFALPNRSSLVAELFTTQEQRDADKREKITDIPLAEIDDFPEQPYRVGDDEDMRTLAESVRERPRRAPGMSWCAVGIGTPAIARLKEDGRYELVSGHRRKMAAMLAGLETMPVIVRQMSRDEAMIRPC